MKLYHFTSHHHLPAIQRSGLIQPTESNVGSPVTHMPPYGAHRGPDVVWLLDTDALNGFSHGLTGVRYDKTEIRITVELPRPIRWLEWPWTESMHPEWREFFMEAGGGMAAVEHWYIWPAAIRRRHWVSIENAHTYRTLWSPEGKTA